MSPTLEVRDFECVLAAEIDPELRELYVRNIPSVAPTYSVLFPEHRVRDVHGLNDLYADGRLNRIHGDIRYLLDEKDPNRLRLWPDAARSDDFIVPQHDLLCAGFPCQPFSKSGAQRGFDDLNGTVFKMLAVILKHRRPRYLLLENVGNFERHDGGNTWRRVKQVLEEDLGYDIRYTGHIGGESSGVGLLSPHDFGMPHHRERFFIIGQLREAALDLCEYPFPKSWRSYGNPALEREQRSERATQALHEIVRRGALSITADQLRAAQLSEDKVRCIDHWGSLLTKIEHYNATAMHAIKMPSFPIWGFELDPWNHYPVKSNPAHAARDLEDLAGTRHFLLQQYSEAGILDQSVAPTGERQYLSQERLAGVDVERWIESWPGYARGRSDWPRWKQRFIIANREWGLLLWKRLDATWLRNWLDALYRMPPSYQKLEWNCQGEELDIWSHVLQFRPSGLRVKRFKSIPALVAMTTTQIPIVPRLNAGEPLEGSVLGARGRHLLPSEALELQGFPPGWLSPHGREAAFKAFGNAVHAGLVREIVRSWLLQAP